MRHIEINPVIARVTIQMFALAVLPLVPTWADDCPVLRDLVRRSAVQGKPRASEQPVNSAALLHEKTELFGKWTRATTDAERQSIKKRMDEITRKIEAGNSAVDLEGRTASIDEIGCDELRAMLSPEDLAYADWESWRGNQRIAPGEDGFISVVRPFPEPQDLRRGLVSGPKFYFVNGLDNSFEEGRNSTQLIANEIGAPVVHVYSKSQKQEDVLLPMVEDVAEAAAYRLGAGSEAQRALAESIRMDLLAGREVRVFAHSRGAAVTYNAVRILQGMGTPEEQERRTVPVGQGWLSPEEQRQMLPHVTVVTLGGYAPAWNAWPRGPRVVDIQNQKDAIPWLWNPMDRQKKPGEISVEEHAIPEYLPWLKVFRRDQVAESVYRTGSYRHLTPPRELEP